MTVAMAMNLPTYGFSSGHAGIAIDSSTAQPEWPRGSSNGTVLLAVSNSGNITAQFLATPLGCCTAQPDGSCLNSSAITISTQAAQTIAAQAKAFYIFAIGRIRPRHFATDMRSHYDAGSCLPKQSLCYANAEARCKAAASDIDCCLYR